LSCSDSGGTSDSRYCKRLQKRAVLRTLLAKVELKASMTIDSPPTEVRLALAINVSQGFERRPPKARYASTIWIGDKGRCLSRTPGSSRRSCTTGSATWPRSRSEFDKRGVQESAAFRDSVASHEAGQGHQGMTRASPRIIDDGDGTSTCRSSHGMLPPPMVRTIMELSRTRPTTTTSPPTVRNTSLSSTPTKKIKLILSIR